MQIPTRIKSNAIETLAENPEPPATFVFRNVVVPNGFSLVEIPFWYAP
jgi:hypothetical protein